MDGMVKWRIPAALWATLLLFAACGDRTADEAATAAPVAAEPDVDMPPATAPGAAATIQSGVSPTPPAAPALPTGPAPAPGTIGYGGFGPAAYGGTVESLRMAWGKELDGAPGEAGGCHQLRPAGGSGFSFMVEGDTFVRTDVRRDDLVAPGGGKVGMGAANILALYGDRVDARPHEYVDAARMLRIADPAGGKGVLVFETDAGGTVVAWRTGIAPQVDYVEGCS